MNRKTLSAVAFAFLLAAVPYLMGALTPSSPTHVGNLTVTGALWSSRACAAAYTRKGPNYCAKNTPGSVSLSTGCTTVSLPAAGVGIKALLVSVSVIARSDNAVGQRTADVTAFFTAGCSSLTGMEWHAYAYEHTAVAADTSLAWDASLAIVPTSSDFYIQFNRDASNRAIASYTIVGYLDGPP